jgi:hypothetical protein
MARFVNMVFEEIENNKNGIYKAGAYCAILIIIIYLIDLIFVIKYGPVVTKSVPEIFEIFQKNRIIGLLQSFSLDIVAAIIRLPLMLALFVSLIKIKKSFYPLILSLIFGFIGITVYLSYNSVFSMLHLSDLYASTDNMELKKQLIAIGYTYLSSFDANGIQPFISFTFFGIWGILLSIIMFKSKDYGRVMAIIGMVGFILEQGPPAGIYPQFWKEIDPILIGIGGVFIIVWYLLVFIKLIRLSNMKNMDDNEK